MTGHRYAYLEQADTHTLDYFDEQSTILDYQLAPFEVYERITSNPPRLVRGLFRFRDLLGYPFGIRPIQGFDSTRKSVRDGVEYVDFFELVSSDDQSLKLASSDHHLDVLINIQTGAVETGHQVKLTARVKCKNRIGLLYMLPVRPIHRLLVRYMLQKL